MCSYVFYVFVCHAISCMWVLCVFVDMSQCCSIKMLSFWLQSVSVAALPWLFDVGLLPQFAHCFVNYSNWVLPKPKFCTHCCVIQTSGIEMFLQVSPKNFRCRWLSWFYAIFSGFWLLERPQHCFCTKPNCKPASTASAGWIEAIFNLWHLLTSNFGTCLSFKMHVWPVPLKSTPRLCSGAWSAKT